MDTTTYAAIVVVIPATQQQPVEQELPLVDFSIL
jgi:hypothetical protein